MTFRVLPNSALKRSVGQLTIQRRFSGHQGIAYKPGYTIGLWSSLFLLFVPFAFSFYTTGGHPNAALDFKNRLGSPKTSASH